MADSYLGPFNLKPKSPSLYNFPFTFSPFSTSLSFSLMAARHCLCSSSSPTSVSSIGSHHQPSLLVFSGGTAFNGVVEELKKLTTRVAHVLPVSDDGGSTAEIVRVLGGPAVGDIRSRCLRLSDQSTSEARAVRILLGHRLPLDPQRAKSEWYDIVEGSHDLWRGVSKPYRETIRAFLAYFQDQILRRSDELFCFSNGSIGNFFFAGARLFFQSLDAAIFLFSRVSEIPAESLVLPVISTNERLTLGCELLDGTVIRGQNEISHPTHGSMQPIDKVFPTVNPTALEQLRSVDCIIFAMGSLFTSICPSLVLLGVGETISSRTCPKVLLLNGTHDRETSGFGASCFVTAITDALNRTYGNPHNCLKNPPNKYLNTLLVPKNGQIHVDIERLASQGIFNVVTVDSIHDPKMGVLFDPKSLIQALSNLLTDT
nr:putative gluconeogenesis factor isoform X2 [Nicotiana tomentosiformis]